MLPKTERLNIYDIFMTEPLFIKNNSHMWLLLNVLKKIFIGL
jgi:hypothetical protein